jgi:hypothetical protein
LGHRFDCSLPRIQLQCCLVANPVTGYSELTNRTSTGECR